MSTNHFCLKWNNFTPKVCESLHDLWLQGEHIDVNLVTDSKVLFAHRLLLSACSRFFRTALQNVPVNQMAVLLLPNIVTRDLEDLLQFIYTGEINVEEQRLKSLVNTANLLQIEGISSPNTPRPQEEEFTKPRALKRKLFTEASPIKKVMEILPTEFESVGENDGDRLQPVKIEATEVIKDEPCSQDPECSFDDSLSEIESWNENFEGPLSQCTNESGGAPENAPLQKLPADVKKVKLASGRIVYHYMGYRYFHHNLHARKKGGCYLRCTTRTRDGMNMLNCRGRLFVDRDGMLELRVGHNHAPDWEKIRKDLINVDNSAVVNNILGLAVEK